VVNSHVLWVCTQLCIFIIALDIRLSCASNNLGVWSENKIVTNSNKLYMYQ
jgi:hypothetical protein